MYPTPATQQLPSPSPGPSSHHHPKPHVSSPVTCQLPSPSPGPSSCHCRNLCVSSPITHQLPSPCLRLSSHHHQNPHVSGPTASQLLIHTSTLKSSQHHPVSTPVSASWLGLDAYMEATTTDALPTLTGPVPVHQSRNEDEGDDEDQEQSDHSDQYHASNMGCQGVSETGNVSRPSAHGTPMDLWNRCPRGRVPAECLEQKMLYAYTTVCTQGDFTLSRK